VNPDFNYGWGSQVMDYEFSERGPSQGSGDKVPRSWSKMWN